MPLGYVHIYIYIYMVAKLSPLWNKKSKSASGRAEEGERENAKGREIRRSARRKRKATREGEIEGVVGQWSVNHRHGVMTRLSFQRLHRRKSSVRGPPSSLPRAPSPFLSRSTLSPSERATAWFLLQESIPWLQESGGFYVKILQKIMARYTFHHGAG